MKKILLIFLTLLCISFSLCAQNNQPVKVPAIPFSLYLENSAAKVEATADKLVITAGAKTDMFRDPNVTYNTDNAPKLLFKPDNDFVLTAAIEHDFTSKWDGGALVLKADSLNWVKFCFEKDYTGAKRIVSVVTKNVSDDCNAAEVAGNKVFFKIAKAGNVITLYYSLTGKEWLLVRHLQFDFEKGFAAGFLAQSPTGDSCTVTFSNIQYEAKKIKDPYAGE